MTEIPYPVTQQINRFRKFVNCRDRTWRGHKVWVRFIYINRPPQKFQSIFFGQILAEVYMVVIFCT